MLGCGARRAPRSRSDSPRALSPARSANPSCDSPARSRNSRSTTPNDSIRPIAVTTLTARPATTDAPAPRKVAPPENRSHRGKRVSVTATHHQVTRQGRGAGPSFAIAETQARAVWRSRPHFDSAPAPSVASTPRMELPAPADTLAPSGVPACVVKPERTQGPYFVDNQLDRSDISGSNRLMAPTERASHSRSLSPSRKSPTVDAHQWPTRKSTSGTATRSVFTVASTTNMTSSNTSQQKFRRGYQMTDTDDRAQFTTTYPGWYTGHHWWSVRIYLPPHAQLPTTACIRRAAPAAPAVGASSPGPDRERPSTTVR